MEYVESRLEELIDKNVGDLLTSNKVEKMILDRVSYYIKNGTVGRWRNNNTFEDMIKQQVKSVVEDQLQKNCEVKFQFLPNSIQFIKED